MNRRVLPLLVALLLPFGFTPAHAQSAPAPAAQPVDSPVVPAAVAPTAETAGAQTDHATDSAGDLRDLPPEVLARLSPAQVVEVLTRREKTRAAINRPPEMHMEEVLVPAFLFAMTVAIVALILRFRYRRHEKLHETMQRMIDKGVEIPPALILPPVTADGDLRKGLVLTLTGLALSNALLWVSTPGTWSLGLIPVFMGLGYLAVWRITAKSKFGA